MAVAATDPEVVAESFPYYLGRNPHDGRYFGVKVGRDGRTNPDELARAVARLVQIRTRLEGARTRPDGGRRGSTGLGKRPGLSDHLEARSPIQQACHEAPEIDLMFNKDDTEARREVFPGILS